MDEVQGFINQLENATKLSDDVVAIVERIAELKVPEPVDSGNTNEQVLRDFIVEFQFDWDNFETGDVDSYDEAEKKFASDIVSKVKQILADIKASNQYTRVFTAKVAYSKLSEESYTYKMQKHKMKAKSIEEASEEKDDIRSKAPAKHPEDKDYALEDVRVLVRIVDQSDKTVLEEKFLLN